jgi:hypothetical protein
MRNEVNWRRWIRLSRGHCLDHRHPDSHCFVHPVSVRWDPLNDEFVYASVVLLSRPLMGYPTLWGSTRILEAILIWRGHLLPEAHNITRITIGWL